MIGTIYSSKQFSKMTKRFEHIDAFRGLCIFAVVYGHIILFCGLKQYPRSAIETFFSDYFLVGFYFISGFLGYKNNMLQNAVELGQYVWKKTHTLLIPSIAVMATYCIIVKGDIRVLWSPWNMWVTWFTYVLFSITFIYGVFTYLFRKTGKKHMCCSLLFVTALLSYTLARQKIEIGGGICLGKVLYYYPYFVLGVLCRAYQPLFEKFMASKILLPIVALLYAAYHYIAQLPLFVCSICSILLVYGVVYRLYENTDSVNIPFNVHILSVLSTLGRYSLEIYFVHFVLLFNLPASIVNYLTSLGTDTCWWGHSSLSFAEFVLLCPLTLILSYASIYISHLIKQIPYFGQVFFGRK